MSVEEAFNQDPSHYDAVILGSGTRLGRWHRNIREWLAAHRDVIRQIPVACFTVGLHGVKADGTFDSKIARPTLERIMTASGISSDIGETFFPGWKRTEGFSSMERIALRVYPLAEGDYRDWDRVDSWVRSIAPALTGDAGSGPGAGVQLLSGPACTQTCAPTAAQADRRPEDSVATQRRCAAQSRPQVRHSGMLLQDCNPRSASTARRAGGGWPDDAFWRECLA